MSNDGLNKIKLGDFFSKPLFFKTFSDSETRALGYEMGQTLSGNAIVCFFGDLGAGKTTFIKGLASAASGCSPDQVSSPTFTYLNIYQGQGLTTVYHFDLYRLHDADEFLSMGFDEFFFEGGICCIEWSERIERILPSNCLKVTLKHNNEQEREVIIQSL
jgi:tRNA threonylcarbamoyladenosine biosynthesis protein TsaE